MVSSADVFLLDICLSEHILLSVNYDISFSYDNFLGKVEVFLIFCFVDLLNHIVAISADLGVILIYLLENMGITFFSFLGIL